MALVIAAGACGDKSETRRDAAVGDDSNVALVDAAIDAPPDAFCPARATGQVGGPCSADSECDSSGGASDGLCLRAGILGTVMWPVEGYCVNKIDTCTDDASCGAGNACVTITSAALGGTYTACVAACATGDCVCSSDQLCSPALGIDPISGGRMACSPGNAAARDGSACIDLGDCNTASRCVLDENEYPGGYCQRVGCTIGTDTTCVTGGDGHCVDGATITSGVDTIAVCVDACVNAGDCRQNDGYKCFEGGATLGKYCRHPQIGDACSNDNDCGPATDWDCQTGFPGGHCTLASPCLTPGSVDGCSQTAACYDPAAGTNFCVDRCTGTPGTQGSCRTGYTCSDVDPGGGTLLGCVPP